MTAPTIAAEPVVGWDATDEEWEAARRHGLGGSDISAVLGFDRYTSPWEVWAEKTGVRHVDLDSLPAEIGTVLEPWLRDRAARILGEPVAVTPHRTYRHPQHGWRLCSPDGITADRRLVELKTAGLVTGYGTPPGWADGAVPLGYEFQVRWAMHVMDAPAAEVVALVAGLGLVRRTVERDHAIEADLVDQLTHWWGTHVVGGVEPAMGTDPGLLAERYPTPNGKTIDLGATGASEHWIGYREAREREAAAKADKDRHGAALKALLGDNEVGTVDGNCIATWGPKKSPVDWPRLAADLAQQAGVPVPDPETYRKPPTRALNVKD